MSKQVGFNEPMRKEENDRITDLSWLYSRDGWDIWAVPTPLVIKNK